MCLKTMAKRYKRFDTLVKPPAHSESAHKQSIRESVELKELSKIRRPPKERRFHQAFIISLTIIAILSLLIFIPYVGPFIGLTLVPYIACNLGCRYVDKRNGVQVGILVGVIWSIIEIYLLFIFLSQVRISVTEPAILTNLDAFIIVFIFISNIIFCIIGGYIGGQQFEKGLGQAQVQSQERVQKKKQRRKGRIRKSCTEI